MTELLSTGMEDELVRIAVNWVEKDTPPGIARELGDLKACWKSASLCLTGLCQ